MEDLDKGKLSVIIRRKMRPSLSRFFRQTLWVVCFSGILWAVFQTSWAQEPPASLQQGIDALKANHLEEAIALLGQAVQDDPKSSEGHFYLGVAFHLSKRYPAAEAAYRKALELDPAPEILLRLGSLLEDTGRYQEALDAYRSVGERAGESKVGEDARRRLLRIEIRIHLNRAVVLTQEEKLQESLSEFEAVIRLDPRSAEAYFGMGEIYRRLRAWDKAIENTGKAVEFDPKHFRAHFSLGQFYEARFEWDRARQSYERVIALRPESQEGKEAAARLPEVKRKIRIDELIKETYSHLIPLQKEKAQEGIKALFDIAPDHFMSYYFRGFFEETQNLYEEAVRDLNRAIELQPDFLPASSKLGQVQGRLGNYEKSFSLLNEVIAKGEPGSEVVIQAKKWLEEGERAQAAAGALEKAKGAAGRGETTEAMESLTETIRLRPDDVGAYLALAVLYIQAGDEENALATLRLGAENNPKSAQIYLQLGLLLEKRGDLEGARYSLQQARSLGKGKPEAEVAGKHLQSVESREHFQEANTQVSKGDFQAALKEIQAVIDLFPNDPSSYLSQGIIFDRMDRPEEAIAAFRKAIELDPDYLNAHIELAMVFEANGRFDEARVEYETTLSLNPGQMTEDQIRTRLNDLPRVEKLYGHTQKARQLLTEDRYEESLAEIDTLILLEPSNYLGYFLRGMNFVGLKKPMNAIEAFKRSLELAPKAYAIRFQLARVYMEEGRFEEAREEFERIAREAEGTKEGELSLIGLKRLRDLSYSFSYAQSMDSNLAQSRKAVTGVTSSLNGGLRYILIRGKEGSLQGGGGLQHSIYYRTQGVGDSLSGFLLGLYRLEGWMLNLRLNLSDGFFDGEKTSTSRGGTLGASMTEGEIPSQIDLKYSLVQARSLRSASGNADQHSAAVTLSQQFTPRDRGNVTYSFVTNVNRVPLGSNFAYRSNALQLGYNREIYKKLSGNLGLNGTYFHYSNPDSGSIFRKFRKTFQYGYSGGLSFPLSEEVTFGLNYSFVKSDTNIQVGTREILELEEILASPIPLVGGDYERHSVSVTYSMSF